MKRGVQRQWAPIECIDAETKSGRPAAVAPTGPPDAEERQQAGKDDDAPLGEGGDALRIGNTGTSDLNDHRDGVAGALPVVCGVSERIQPDIVAGRRILKYSQREPHDV